MQRRLPKSPLSPLSHYQLALYSWDYVADVSVMAVDNGGRQLPFQIQ